MSGRAKLIGWAPVMAVLASLFITGCTRNGARDVKQPLPDFDEMWDFNEPAATERRFRELLPAAEASGDVSYHAQLLTQIARTQGLQDRFDDAHATLDRARPLFKLTADALCRARYHLERGRVYNSAGRPARAMECFDIAESWAETGGHARFRIDAVHMMGIAAATPQEQIKWNLRGIELVEQHPGQDRWLQALFNNLGESYAKAGDYAKALGAFEKLAAINHNDQYTLKDQSRMLRLMGRVDRAVEVIRPIHERLESEGKRDGWISEEYAECLLAAGRADEATPHFRVAHELLKDDPWVLKNEPAKVERLRRLGGE